MSERAGAGEKVSAGLAMGSNMGGEGLGPPSFSARFECIRPVADGTVKAWDADWQNYVVSQGRAHIINQVFGGKTDHRFCHLGIHSCSTTSSTWVWADASGSQVTGQNSTSLAYLNSSRFTGTLYSSAGNSTSVSTAFAFTSDMTTQAVWGAAVLFGSANAMNTTTPGGTNATQMILYSIGHFAASRQVSGGDTLNVTLNISYT